MKLTVKERIQILSILPRQSNYINLRQIRDLEFALSFTDDEQSVLKFENLENGVVRWDDSGEQEKEFNLSEPQSKVISNALRAISSGAKLEMDMLDLYERFIPPVEE